MISLYVNFIFVYDEKNISQSFWREESSGLITVLMKDSIETNLEAENPFPTFLPKIRCPVGEWEHQLLMHSLHNIFPVSLPINWSATSRHGKVAGSISLHIPALFACKGKKLQIMMGSVTWTPVGLKPQIISQIARQLPKISLLSSISFLHSFP